MLYYARCQKCGSMTTSKNDECCGGELDVFGPNMRASLCSNHCFGNFKADNAICVGHVPGGRVDYPRCEDRLECKKWAEGS